MLTLDAIIRATRHAAAHGEGQHFFGRGHAHPLRGQIPRDHTTDGISAGPSTVPTEPNQDPSQEEKPPTE